MNCSEVIAEIRAQASVKYKENVVRMGIPEQYSIGVGKRDFDFNEKALLLAHEFVESDSKAQRWIGKDAIKELEKMVKVEGRGRLISSDSKMGKSTSEAPV